MKAKFLRIDVLNKAEGIVRSALLFFAGAMLFMAANAQAQNLFVANAGTGDILEITPAGVTNFFASGLDQPWAVAFNNAGDLFVADRLGNAITEITPAGVKSAFATGLTDPQALAFDSAGNLFVAQLGAQSIIKIATNGTVSNVSTNIIGNPSGLAFDSMGNLYVCCNTLNANLYKIAVNGMESVVISNEPEFRGVAINSAGDLFAADSSGIVFEVAPNGTVNTFGPKLAGSPEGMAFDKAGNLYVTVAGAADEIIKITPGGATNIIFSESAAPFDTMPEGLAFQFGPAFNFSDTGWWALGSGMNNEVFSLAISGTNLFAGGYFTTAGGTTVNGVAQWNGSAWSAVGSGPNPARAMAVIGTNLYAGDEEWNGSSWTTVGGGVSGFDATIYAAAVMGTNLFVAGYFTEAGGVAATNIAEWNGNSWSALGTGLNNYVWALAVQGTNLFAGGQFSSAGGVAATNIAEWNGTTWSPVGTGPNGSVLSFAVAGTNLYVGGNFTMAGGVAATNIAEWNGNSWSALGAGLSGGMGYVWALAASGNNLFAAGNFNTTGGFPVNNIAEWNGYSWSAMGSGIGGDVFALTAAGSSLFAGGQFSSAGTNDAAYNVAEAVLSPPGIITTDGNFGFNKMSGQFGFDVSGGPVQTVVVEGSTNLSDWAPLQTNVFGGSNWYFADPSTGNFSQHFYRAQLVP